MAESMWICLPISTSKITSCSKKTCDYVFDDNLN